IHYTSISSSSSSSPSAAMLARSLLLILLVLACRQYIAMAQSAKGPEDCCFRFFTKPIPIRAIKTYINTSTDCPKNGIMRGSRRAKP
ncbi:hypothetical protein QTP86_030298, partial [Hemibagrus guttatus]